MNAQIAQVRKGIYIEIVSVVWMIIEAVVAVGVGTAVHSLVLIAFGADSVIELLAGIILLWRLYVEANGMPLQRVQQAEKTASWVVGIALLMLAVYIVILAIYDLWTKTGSEFSWVGFTLALAASIVMPFIARSKNIIGGQIGSKALQADGSCSFVCAYMAWSMLAGLMLTAVLGWWWLNSVVVLPLVYFVVKEGVEAIQVARGVEDACGCGHV